MGQNEERSRAVSVTGPEDDYIPGPPPTPSVSTEGSQRYRELKFHQILSNDMVDLGGVPRFLCRHFPDQTAIEARVGFSPHSSLFSRRCTQRARVERCYPAGETHDMAAAPRKSREEAADTA